MELTPSNLMWLSDIMTIKKPPVLPTMPDFLRENENLNDHLLKISINKIRKDGK